MLRDIKFSSNNTEQLVASKFFSAGWTVYRNGWPDFLFEKDGRLKWIEVKQRRRYTGSDGKVRISKTSKLSRSQRRIHKALKAYGIEVQVIHIDIDGNVVAPTGRNSVDKVLSWEEFLA